MKKTLLILFSALSCCFYAQSYSEKEFQQAVGQVNAAKTENDYDNAFKKLSMFTSTKPTDRWQAYYYAAVSMYLKAESSLKKGSGQESAEANAFASKYANAAKASQSNTETDVLTGLIAVQKMQISNSKDAQDLRMISELASKAGSDMPNNPRAAILKAKIQEQMGNKENAEKLFQQAKSGFESKSSSAGFAPNWGRQLILNN